LNPGTPAVAPVADTGQVFGTAIIDFRGTYGGLSGSPGGIAEDQPARDMLIFFKSEAGEVFETRSGPDGSFKANLPPGMYGAGWLHPAEVGKGFDPFVAAKRIGQETPQIEVEANKITSIHLITDVFFVD
jgi:hypothetical protein